MSGEEGTYSFVERDGWFQRNERNCWLKFSGLQYRSVDRDLMAQKSERKDSFNRTGWWKWNERNDSFKIDGGSPAVAVIRCT